MAIWQVNFYILPNDEETVSFENLDIDNFDEEKFWLKRTLDSTFFNKISTFLPLGISWSNNLKVFGNLDSNVLEVFSDKDVVDSVSFRIDFTTNYMSIISNIIHFCNESNLIILDYNFKNTFNKLENILNAISQSANIRNYAVLSSLPTPN